MHGWCSSLVTDAKTGIVSIMIALASFWFIPNFPESTGTYFLTAEESQMAQYRQTVSAGGQAEDDEGDYLGGVWMALKDPFTYLFSAIHFSLIIAQSYKDFFPSVSLGLSASFNESNLLIIIPDPRYPWIHRYYDISHPGASSNYRLYGNSSSVLVFWSYARAWLPYYRTHSSYTGGVCRNDHDS